MDSLLLSEIKACQICKGLLPFDPKPIIRFNKNSKIAIIGQAPGNVVHKSGLSFDDRSGDTLREWLGVTKDEFYNPNNFAIIPMAFCFPGKAKSGGDAPPRKECAKAWHEEIFKELNSIELIILVGSFAINYYLKRTKKKNLTETVRHFEEYYQIHFPIVHPSPLNFRWHSKNQWFIENVVPVLQLRVREILGP